MRWVGVGPEAAPSRPRARQRWRLAAAAHRKAAPAAAPQDDAMGAPSDIADTARHYCLCLQPVDEARQSQVPDSQQEKI